MSLGSGAIVATARVLLGVDDTQLAGGMRGAEEQVRAGTQQMSSGLSRLQEAQLKAKLAQESYTSAVARFGPESKQAQRALLSLSQAERTLSEETSRSARELQTATTRWGPFRTHLKGAEQDMGRATRGFVAGSGAVRGLGRQIAFASGTFLGAAGLAAALTTSIGAAQRFGGAMEMLHTQAHTTQGEVVRMTGALQKLAPSLNTGPETLASGLYHLESQGLRSSKALQALTAAAQGAKIGNANLEDVTNALGATVVAGLVPVGHYREAMGMLNATVGAGDMHMQDLADAMGTGLPVKAKLAGVSLRDLGAALAVFGDNNIRGAKAGTDLASAIRLMGAPSKTAAKVLETVGISATGLADAMRKHGLVAAVQELRDKMAAAGLSANEQNLLIARAFGGKQATGVSILVQELDRLKTKTHEVGSGAKSAASDWAAYQKTGAAAADKFHAEVQDLQLAVGNSLLPQLNKLLVPLNHWLQTMIQSGKLQTDLNQAMHVAVGLISDIAGAVKTGWHIFETAAGWVGGVKNAVEGLLLALAVNKIRGVADSIVTTLIRNGIALVGPAAEGEAVAYGTAMTTMGLATEGLKATIQSALITTGIGAVVVAVSLGVVEIVKHWKTVKSWIVDFADWIKGHAYVLFAVPVVGQFLFMATEAVKHFDDIKHAISKLGDFFSTVFVHPIRAIEDLFSGLWSWLKRQALGAALQMVEPFSHLPSFLGGWARKAKTAIQTQLQGMETDASTAGTQIGTGLGQNMIRTLTPFVQQANGLIGMVGLGGAVQTATGNPNAKPQAGGTAFGLVTKAHQLGVGSGAIYRKGGGHGGISKPGQVLDCSGYVYQVFTQNGFKGFPGTSEAQWSTSSGPNWTSQIIPPSEARPGDVVFMVGSPEYPSPGHVGIVTAGSGSSAEVMQYYQTGMQADTVPLGQVGDLVGVKRFYLVTRASGGGGGASHSGGSTPVSNPAAGAAFRSQVEGIGGGSHKKTKIPLIPSQLQADLDTAEISKSVPKQLAALKAIQDYLQKRIAGEHDIATKVKLLDALKKTINAEGKLTKGPTQPLLPASLTDDLKKASSASDYAKEISVLDRIVAFLKREIARTTDINKKLRLSNQLKKEQTDLQIARAKLAKDNADAAAKAQVAEINAAVAAEKERIAALGGNQAGAVTATMNNDQAIAAAQTRLDVAQQKLGTAQTNLNTMRKKYGAGSKQAATAADQVASAQAAVDSATASLAKAKAGQGKIASAGQQIVFDPKTQTYMVVDVSVDVDGLKQELTYLLTKVLPKIDGEISKVKAAIKRLSKHRQANKTNIARLQGTLKALQKEKAGMLATATDLNTSINEIQAVLAQDPEAQNLPDPTTTPDSYTPPADTGASATPDSTFTDTSSPSPTSASSSSSSSDSGTSAPAAPTQADIDAQVSGYLSGLYGLATGGFASNVLAAAFRGMLGPTPPPTVAGLRGGGNQINMTMYFPQAPADPHLFSQAVAFELANV